MADRALPLMPGVDPAAAPEPGDPAWEAWVESVVFSPEGVDRSQIWASLHRTPDERLAILQRAVNDLLRLRGAAAPELR